MTAGDFQQILSNRFVLLDGATGSNLFLRGMPSGVCPELWILEHPEVLIGLQKEYVDAGTDILYVPSFGANRLKLAEYGLESKVSQMNCQLVELSRKAGNERTLLAGDLTMTGKQLYPLGNIDFEELIDVYKEQVLALYQAGVDLFVVETMMSLQETRAAVIAINEVCDLPIMATMTFGDDGRTLFGSDPVTCAMVLEGLGVDAVGANCSAGPDVLASYIKEMAKYTHLPLIAKPNAGLPYLKEDGTCGYRMGANEFALQMKEIINSGATILGGCCGTNPDYIRAIKEITEGEVPVKREYTEGKRILTSERKSLIFDEKTGFLVIGERINPTGKKKLQAELRENNLETVLKFAEEQENAGANVLDINMGMSGINEKEMFKRAMLEVMTISDLPLSIDSSDCDVIEEALRRYPGRALVNSVSMEPGKAERLFPIIKKYGAMFILLPLSESGLPKNLKEKTDIIDQLVNKAKEYGLGKDRIIVDGLVTTVSANKEAALETLETIQYCQNQELLTVCGLSNISFGLPERSNINTAFLTCAIMKGLSMAICNPLQTQLMNAVYATDLLMNKEKADLNYIEQMTKHENTATEVEKKVEPIDTLSKLKNAILKGNGELAVTCVNDALKEGTQAIDILNQILLPAINEVGELFNSGKYFLPQLIASANAMKDAIEIIEPLLQTENKAENMPKVVIATVKGDIHDIGKNLVALMLKNYGMTVFDLGKDVSKEEIIDVAMKKSADVIALSALMTTTMTEMKNVVQYAKEKNLTCKIIIGGAVITPEYAEEIGADGYSKDAARAVTLVKELLHC